MKKVVEDPTEGWVEDEIVHHELDVPDSIPCRLSLFRVLPSRFPEPVKPLLDGLHEVGIDFGLALEVVVDHPIGNSGTEGNVLDRDLLMSPFTEQIVQGPYDLLPFLCGFADSCHSFETFPAILEMRPLLGRSTSLF